MKAISYNNKYFRILAAFAATLIILFHDRPFDLQNALSRPMLYPAFVASFFVSILIIYVVHLITIRLDTRYPWTDGFIERLVHQVRLGIAAPAATDFCFFFIYFLIKGDNIITNDYLAGDFWYVIFLLLLLNLYYALHAGFNIWRMRINDKKIGAGENEKQAVIINEVQISGQPKVTETEVLIIRYKRTEVYLMPEDIYCFYKAGNYVHIITSDRKNYTTLESISSLESRFRNSGLLRINREVIINKEIVKGYQTGFLRDTLKLLINQKYGFIQQTLTSDQLTVTKDRITLVKAIFPFLRRIGNNSQPEL